MGRFSSHAPSLCYDDLIITIAMRKFLRDVIGGIVATGAVAAGSGEAMAETPSERVAAIRAQLKAEKQEVEQGETNLAWANEMQARFNLALETQDAESTADVIRKFIREYNFPTQGKIVLSNQKNPMRILNPGEWKQLREVAIHFLANSSAWGKEYPGLQRQLNDVVERIETHIDEPGPVRGHQTSVGNQGKIDRSLGF